MKVSTTKDFAYEKQGKVKDLEILNKNSLLYVGFFP